MMQQTPVFDDLDGEFQGRLREIVSTTRQTADGTSTVTFSTAGIECDYNPKRRQEARHRAARRDTQRPDPRARTTSSRSTR